MASTPPRTAGTPQDQAWRAWAEERIATLTNALSVANTQIAGASAIAATGANVATQAASVANASVSKNDAPAPTSLIAADLLNVPFWTSVINGSTSVFPAPLQSNARNVVSDVTGIIMTPTPTEASALDVTNIMPVPPTRRVSVTTTDVSVFTYRVNWRDINGNIFLDTVTTGGVCLAPVAAAQYNVTIERAAGLAPATATNATVFNVVGSGGMFISPGGISVEIGGVPVSDISPTTPVPVAPTAPTLTTAVGVIVVHWAGTMSSGSIPTNFNFVYAQESANGTTGWTRVGQPLTGAGDISRTVAAGTVRYYRLIAQDNLGRDSVPSSVAGPITSSGVGMADIDSVVAAAIANAQTTADGKNRIVVSVTTPTLPGTPPFVAGDQWWIRDATDPNKLTGVKVFNGTSFVNYLMVADTIIVPGSAGTTVIADGAVTTAKVAAGAITTNSLSPTVGSSLDISANGSINIIVGQQDAQAAVIADNTDDITSLNTQMDATVTAVGTVSDTATTAAGNATTALTTANAANDAITAMGQTYSFTPTGAFIGAPGSPYQFVVQNTGAQILFNGTPVSSWDSGTMTVPSFVGVSVVLGHHKIEADPAGTGTVVRAI